MRSPSVAIIVPVYRTPVLLLQRFLQSARRQTLPDVQIIAVDDASPDECPRVLDAAAASDARVQVVHRRTNGGAGPARNDGLERADSEFVLFADADDVIRPDMCETLMGLAERHDADIAACSWAVVDENGRVLSLVRLPNRTYELLASARHKTRCYRNLNYAPWNKLFRREVIGRLRFEQFEANIGEDTLFNVAALCRSRTIVTTSYVGYGYTSHSTSATGRSAKGMAYLRTIALSEEKLRLTLAERDGSAIGRQAADWLALKRFTTGCAWIAEDPDSEERRRLWDYWRRHLRDHLLPALEHRGLLAAWYRRVALTASAATACRLTRLATKLADAVSLLERVQTCAAGRGRVDSDWLAEATQKDRAA